MSPESPESPAEKYREVRYEHSRDFVEILRQLGISLLVSTYQAGKLVLLGSHRKGLSLSFHNFEQAMGLAVQRQQIAVGGKTQIWLLRAAPGVVSQMAPELEHDGCFLARSSHFTDDIHVHEMDWSGDDLWLANTRFSCLCTVDEDHSFVPRWKPPFISRLAAEDRCHLNGLCVDGGQPKWVTAMAETDTAAGWRPVKASAGCLIDVTSSQTVARGFAMPHSPRIHGGRVWVLDSGRGRLVTVDPSSGTVNEASRQPGYTRGLDFSDRFAFIGLSRIRETSTFGDVPIAEQRDQLKCAVAVVDLQTGQRVAYLEFLSGVEEIFEVRVLHGMRNPLLTSPMAHAERANTIWYVPPPTALTSQFRAAGQEAEHRESDRTRTPEDAIAPAAASEFRRGNEFAEQDRFADAQPCFEEAIALYPPFAEAHCNLGLAVQYQGQAEASIPHFERALALTPRMAAAHLNLAASQFLQRDLGRAWHEYEWRWKCAQFGDRLAVATKLAPAWDGSSLSGCTLLVYGEQGIGDEIMFASCLPELVVRADRCIVACETRLAPIFRRSLPGAVVTPIDELQRPDVVRALGRVDYQIAAGSVPRFLRPTLDHFPRDARYLLADSSAVQRRRDRFGQLGQARTVGISWKGGKEGAERRRRSTRLESWQSLFHVANTQFVNLQYGDFQSDVKAVRDRSGVVIHHWDDVDPLTNMDAFSAQIAALDAVVSIDNSTIHLAGALGVPTLAMLSFPSSSYWRWFLEGEETVWYRSLRLFRRQHPEPWEPIFQQVATTLAELLMEPRDQ